MLLLQTKLGHAHAYFTTPQNAGADVNMEANRGRNVWRENWLVFKMSIITETCDGVFFAL